MKQTPQIHNASGVLQFFFLYEKKIMFIDFYVNNMNYSYKPVC